MEIILKEDIVNLGYKDEIVTVKNGYGRNFLIPKGKAIIASDAARKVLAENKKQRAHKIAKINQDAKDLAAQMADIKLIIGTKTSASGTIYGSVTNIIIANELAKQGFEIDRKTIILKEPVKEIGEYVAQVCLTKDVTLDIPFEVISES